jgi:hypothetical protein
MRRDFALRMDIMAAGFGRPIASDVATATAD